MGWFGWRELATRAVLVAGRSYDFSDFTRAQVLTLCETIDVIATRTGTPLVTVPADIDLADEGGTDDDDPSYCSAFIGVLVAEGGTYEPLLVAREAMLEAVEQARALPAAVWDEITAAYREAGGKQPSEEAIVLSLGCTGGLPMAKLAFGVLGAEDAGLGGDFVHGQAPDQTSHAIGVHGQKLAHCSYDGSSAKPFDIGEEAHAARAREVPKGGYYLIARYD